MSTTAAEKSYRLAASGVVRVLSDLGIVVVSRLGELAARSLEERRMAAPALIGCLRDAAYDPLKMDVLRVLAVRPAPKHVAPALIEAFRAERSSTVRWSIGGAIESIADDRIVESLSVLAVDRTYGIGRQMLVQALGKMKAPGVVDTLLSLLGDDDVIAQAVYALGKLKSVAARPVIAGLLTHKRSLVRREAKAALAKIDKVHGVPNNGPASDPE
jgi:HEAT repeat protein